MGVIAYVISKGSVNSRLFVANFLGSQNLYTDVQLHEGLAPQSSVKGQPHIHTTKYYLAIKMNKVLIRVITWTNFENLADQHMILSTSLTPIYVVHIAKTYYVKAEEFF